MPYTVVKGDSLGKIAARYGITWQQLYEANKDVIGSNPDLIRPGQTYVIPGDDGWEDASSGSGEGGGGSEPASGGSTPSTTKALPRGSKLVKIGNNYRVIWQLGDGLGWAWYDISPQQLKEIYDTETPTANINLDNAGQFEAKYGNNYWGNVGEVNLNYDDPWQDLKERIFNQFGYVPGFDDKEIQRLLVQAFFEDWDQNQWTVEYRNTEYYQSTTDTQRRWVGLSEAQQNQLVADEAAQLKSLYQSIWSAEWAMDEAEINDAAFKIASGQTTRKQWEWDQRQAAAKEEGTLEANRRRQEQEELRAEGNQIENLAAYAEAQWRAWVGPVDMPANFANRWGNDLASGKASEADLEAYLKRIATARWQYKPEDVTWEDWASTYKSQIKNTLELGSLDDSDPLLNSILNQDITGQDIEQMIRKDTRFRSTRRMYGELSSTVEDIGRRFGYIA